MLEAPCATTAACGARRPADRWPGPGVARLTRAIGAPVLAWLGIIAILAIAAPAQALDSLHFTARAMTSVFPFLAVSVMLAAAARASQADRLIARVFVGRELRMVVLAAVFGALSPFCSCGVIPVIAGLLAAGVPLAPVMTFWLASPSMDPELFVLLAGQLGLEFALAKTIAAVGISLGAGLVTLGLSRLGLLSAALRPGADGGCAAPVLDPAQRPVWTFWRAPARRREFVREAAKTGLFLARWLLLAFLLESLMTVYLPADLIASWLGGTNPWSIPAAVLLGAPAYLNSYAAIPLVSGLIEKGMDPAVGLAFMLAGAMTSMPAALAVWAMAKPRLFALYIGLAAGGAIAASFGYAAWLNAGL